ncbi:MAG: hypothetical protein ACKVTZ_08310 [Bacteroidia bacterium]
MQKSLIFNFLLLHFLFALAQSQPKIEVHDASMTIGERFIAEFYTPQDIESKFGKKYHVFDFGKYGKSYLYDSLGIGFRFDSLGTKLQYVVISFQTPHRFQPYLPAFPYKDSLNIWQKPQNYQSNVLTILNSYVGKVHSLSLDLGRVITTNEAYTLYWEWEETGKWATETGKNYQQLRYLVLYFCPQPADFKPFHVQYQEGNLGSKDAIENAFIQDAYYKAIDFESENPKNIEFIASISEAEPIYQDFSGADEGELLRAYEKYKKMTAAERSERYDLKEGSVNSDGYDLMRYARLKAGYYVLKLNAEWYPLRANVFDSMGEACLANGLITESIHHFQQAIHVAENYSVQNYGGNLPLKNNQVFRAKCFLSLINGKPYLLGSLNSLTNPFPKK